jgi:hypothetical protein
MATSILASGNEPMDSQCEANALCTAAAKSEGLRSVQIVPASIGCFYPPEIEGADLLRVDFDCRQIRGDATYLVELVQNGQIVWRGARRFQRKPDLHIDQTGDGDYVPITSVESVGLRVVGCVIEVYKPARRVAELAQALRWAA